MAYRLPASNSEIAENIKKAKEKIIQVYDMLPNFCLNEGIGLYTKSPDTVNISFSSLLKFFNSYLQKSLTYWVTSEV